MALFHALRLDEFHKSQLRGFVAIVLFRAALYTTQGPRLKNRAARQRPVFQEDLRQCPSLIPMVSVDCHFLRLSSQHAFKGIGLRPA